MSDFPPKPSLGLFFSYGVSLGTWQKQGMLSRELTLYRALLNRFEHIYFFTYGCEDQELVDQLRCEGIVVCPKKSLMPNFLYSFFLPFLYKKELQQCTFYKTNQMYGSWTAVLAQWMYDKKLIVRTGFTLSLFAKKKNKLRYWFARLIEWFALKNADAVVVATQEEKDYFSSSKEKIFVIPNFVDTQLFFPREKTTPHTQHTTLLFVGRLSPQKNLQNLLAALEGIPKVDLLVIGTGELLHPLERFAAQKKLSVKFLGNVPYAELPEYIRNADIFVLPSLYEGNPKVLLEAMACGAPVLATSVSGIKNIIVPFENGYLCDTSVEALHAALLAFIPDRALQQKLGAHAHQLVQTQYSVESICTKEIALYRDLHITL